MAGWIKMPLGMEEGLGPGDLCVRWGPSSPRKKNGTAPTQFLAHVYCGQMAGWIKMPLGTEVNLGPGEVVLDGVAAPSPKGGTAPQFSVHVYYGQRAGWMITPFCTEVDLGPDHIMLDRDPAPPRKGHSSPRLLGPCLFWPRSPISATVELFYYYAANTSPVDLWSMISSSLSSIHTSHGQSSENAFLQPPRTCVARLS